MMNLLAELCARRLLAIVRGRDPEAAYRSILVLAEEGVGLLEVSLAGTDSLAVLRRASSALGPAASLGAGTVLTVEDAETAADAGAAFLVSPAVTPGIEHGAALGLPCLPGALTPTEITAAARSGVSAVKVFPASIYGPGYIKAIREPLPHIPLVAVGGVQNDQIAEYLAAGAIAVGVGSPLLGDAPHGGNLNDLRNRIRGIRDALVLTG